MTQLLTLDQIHQSLRGLSRQKDVLHQGFDLATSWWRHEIEKAGLEVRGPLGDSNETIHLDRNILFGLAAEVSHHERDPRDFALHVLLWGSGSTRRNNRGRITSLAEPGGEAILREALEAARANSDDAFDAFRSRGRNTFAHLGPAYFTKLMYFAGEGEPKHASLIVDRRVLTALVRTRIGEGLTTAANYGRDTYQRACAVMEEVASSARDSGDDRLQDCTADLVERWAFDEGGRKPK